MKTLLNPAKVFAMDEDFLIADVRMDGQSEIGPFKFYGITFFCCIEGRFKLHINDKEVIVNVSRATAAHPGDDIILERTDASIPRFLVVSISQKYFFDLKLDMGELLAHLKQDKIKTYISDPTLNISAELFSLLKGHCELLNNIYVSGIQQKKYHYTLLLSSMFNIVNVAFNWDKDAAKSRDSQIGRGKAVFVDFMKLAVEHFETERSIRFYADKMCLTPKYLSKLIKEGCGNSASTIIDNLVVAKAKNLLKHTDLSVKLIAARLNFSSQSSFNKFFKAKTGMSPLRYKAS